MFGFNFTKITDPYNTMGAAPRKSPPRETATRRVRHPNPDEFTYDYVETAEYLTDVPVKKAAPRLRADLDAAARFAPGAWDDAHTYGASDKRGERAVEMRVHPVRPQQPAALVAAEQDPSFQRGKSHGKERHRDPGRRPVRR